MPGLINPALMRSAKRVAFIKPVARSPRAGTVLANEKDRSNRFDNSSGAAFGVSLEGHHPIVHLTKAQCQKVEHIVLV